MSFLHPENRCLKNEIPVTDDANYLSVSEAPVVAHEYVESLFS